MRILLLLCAICLPMMAFNQNTLLNSPKESMQINVYAISKAEAYKLFKSEMDDFDEKLLYRFVGAYTLGAPIKNLDNGNYLLVKSIANKLQVSLLSVGDVGYKIINNNKDFIVYVHDSKGQPIPDAIVKANTKTLVFDKNLQAYILNNYNKDSRVFIEANGGYFAFDIEKSWNDAQWKERNKKPKRPKNTSREDDDDDYNRFDNEKKYSGYMAFNKPKYKPNDTVRLKAFVVDDATKKPIHKKLALRLYDDDDVDTVLATLEPYRNGAYEYSFVLSDSLKMDLDNTYMCILEEITSNGKTPAVIHNSFEYEEYELKSISFTTKVLHDAHERGIKNAIIAKAVDENELAVMDGKLEIYITPNRYSGVSFDGVQSFLPDTLWVHQQDLEPVGETKIEIPDSIFPKASFNYEIHSVFLNSNNERHTSYTSARFDNTLNKIVFTQVMDSLRIEYFQQGIPVPERASLLSINDKDTLRRDIQLPAIIQLDPYISKYIINTGSVQNEYALKGKREVSFNARRTKDSVSIQLYNPLRLPVWYTIYADKKQVAKGLAKELLYTTKSTTAKNYFVNYSYVYGNELYNDVVAIPYYKNNLTIKMLQPKVIYPGQQTHINIDVMDADGKPVADADVTAYAFTKKFSNTNAPGIPYFGKRYPGQAKQNILRRLDAVENTSSTALDFEKWRSVLNLDTMTFYKFLYPQSRFYHKHIAPDSLTQIAPFVVKDGNVIQAHQVYIDEVPTYFHQAEQEARYSFAVSPGFHNIKIRTATSMIRIDSVYAMASMKSIYSFDISKPSKNLKIQPFLTKTGNLSYELTSDEMALWSKYMIAVNDNYPSTISYVQQNNKLLMLPFPNSYRRHALIGPLNNTTATFKVKNAFEQNFEPEGNYTFTIAPGLIKQKETKNMLFGSGLSSSYGKYLFNDFVLTEKEIDLIWENYLEQKIANNDIQISRADYKLNGRLQIAIPAVKDRSIKKLLLFKNDNPSFIKILNAASRQVNNLDTGIYRLYVMYRDNRFVIDSSIVVKPGGLNFKHIDVSKLQQPNHITKRIDSILKSQYNNYYLSNNGKVAIQQSVNDAFFSTAGFTNRIDGYVVDEKTKEPIPGALVSIDGTTFGVLTDFDGFFSMKAPNKGNLVVSFIGYIEAAMAIERDKRYNIRLTEATSRLEEVVVVGYGTTLRREVTGASMTVTSQALEGKLAGVSVADQVALSIRGIASLDANSQPLVIINGIPTSMEVYKSLAATDIAGVNILKGAEATAIYGSRGADGVIIIQTKSGIKVNLGIEQPIASANTLRTHFRDDAFWQPRLRTNKNGRASFTVTFPDDITSWNTYAIAMTDNKQSGYASDQINAFKALSATVNIPQFVVAGDTVLGIAKSTNYLQDSIHATAKYYMNKKQVSNKVISFKNSYIDSLLFSATTSDSLHIRYTIEKDNGYFDGEEKAIPVFAKGVVATKGMFAALRRDTSFTWKPFADTGAVKIHATASLLDIVLDEVEKLKNYEYLCNEQLASKLKGLLTQKKIHQYLKKEFEGDKNINYIIDRLNKAKSGEGLWGWWHGNSYVYWISTHVVGALLQAEAMGYKVQINKSNIVNYLVYQLENKPSFNHLETLKMLDRLQAKVAYKRYLDSLDKYAKDWNQYQQLQLALLKQKLGYTVNIDKWMAQKQTTVFGNSYWGEEGYRFFDNSIQNTLLMYQLLKNRHAADDELDLIRGYLVEQRKQGQWRNTYESSLIMETILPDLLVDGVLPQPAQLDLVADKAYHTASYPYTLTVPATQPVQINKKGKQTVYFTAYQQYWDNDPQKAGNNFVVDSRLLQKGDSAVALKAGTPATLQVMVQVKADAEYVMVEAPIPAGCSYNTKSQGYGNNEVHREYFKNKVSIFCSALKKGNYIFTIDLLPRYSGSYTLNPAKAEMMYFPVFYGREDLKKIAIQ